ncbi:hypothetical protein [Fictibacillus nanhaiensis]|uniref:hypothetical protein n=1 Tax=Fictibacillus nanhaiensis TaxID=742169 RepID=UPI003C2A6143
MKKIFWVKTVVTTLVLSIFSLFTLGTSSPAYAGYIDNPSGVYYDLSKHVYKVTGDRNFDEYNIESLIDVTQPDNKFQVIDSISVNSGYSHPASKDNNSSTLHVLDRTGFKAMAVVIPASKKLFIVFSGSQDITDYNTARNIIQADTPGQLYQAQLYVNYIYKNFEEYGHYNWYFTGHSLGGWLAQKVYLDIRAANWVNTSGKYEYGGAIGKGNISGVYTFNALPLLKDSHVNPTQWNANKNGTYNNDVKNLYIENEWLNSIYDMYSYKLDYIGLQGGVDTSIPRYDEYNYDPSSLSYDIGGYALKSVPSAAHKLASLKNYVAR